MAASSAGLHESPDRLTPGTIDRHRAVVSLMEELEAIDWYDQRAEAANDAELISILIHNRDDEKEHAAMLLEWIRRHDQAWDGQLHRYLYKEGAIEALFADAAAPSGGDGASLGIGQLSDKEVL